MGSSKKVVPESGRARARHLHRAAQASRRLHAGFENTQANTIGPATPCGCSRDVLHNSLRSVIARSRAVRCVAVLANSRAIDCKKSPCGPSRSALPRTREGYAGHPSFRDLFHPDCDRRLWHRTRSADPAGRSEERPRRRSRALAGFSAHKYRRWGIPPRPENAVGPEGHSGPTGEILGGWVAQCRRAGDCLHWQWRLLGLGVYRTPMSAQRTR